jgi:ketosteroid isomerase-like protein
MRARLLAICLVAIVGGCTSRTAPPDDAASAKQVQAALANWRTAFEAKDVAGVMRLYAPGAALTAYDIVPPLQYKGADAYRKDYGEFFGEFDGPLHIETRDDHLELSGGLAVAYGLERISGTLKGGQPVDMWVRYTSAFKRIGNQWLDIHDHVSVPADLNSGKAVIDLKP